MLQVALIIQRYVLLILIVPDSSIKSVERVEIPPTLIGEEEDMLEDLVEAAFNGASNKIKKATKEAMMRLAKDLNLPDNFGCRR